MLDVLRSGRWGSPTGGVVRAFEERFAAFHDARYGVCVANGTLGLMAALRAVGVGPGDEVIVPAYTFIATASAVTSVGAVPRFADVAQGTLLLDAERLEAAITPRTRAVIPVHLAGCPTDMDALCAVARRHHLHVLEDAAQAHGAAWRGRKVGALGDLGMLSFQAGKHMTAGEGGILLTNDHRLADVAWSLVNVGRVPGGAWYQHERVGWNLRLTEFQGAILRAQLDRLPAQIERRERSARVLSEGLAAMPGITPPQRPEGVTTHAWHMYMLRVDRARLGCSKQAFVEALQAEGVPAGTGYLPLNRNQALLREIGRLTRTRAPDPTPCPVAEAAEREVVWLGQNVLLGSDEDLEDVVAAIRKVVASCLADA